MALNTDVPHPARVYDYLLGGKDNFQADRDAADTVVARSPTLPRSMCANRRFMVRAVRYLAAERGVRQFLDIGTGLPTSPNLHEVVQEVDPATRVVYVDNDPIVLVHARALLTSTPQGRTDYVEADLRNPDSILRAPQVVDTLDLGQPVALCLIAILHFLTDEPQVHRIIERLLSPLAPGSFLALSTVSPDSAGGDVHRASAEFNAQGIVNKARSRAEVESLFTGLDLVDPGVVPVHHWRPDEADRAVADTEVHMYCGVGTMS